MKSKSRPKAILKTLSALSFLLPASVAAAESLRPNATAFRTNVPPTEKKKENEKSKIDAKEFEKRLLEKGIKIPDSFGDAHNVGRDVDCKGETCGV